MKKERAVVLIAFAFVLAFAAFFAVIQIVRAFNGPPSGCTPPNCQGAVGVNSSNNLSVGTTTPIANTKFLIVASDTSASNYSLKIIQTSTAPILVVQNNGNLGIATGSPAYQLDVVGTVRATTLLGNWSGTLTSNNVTNGVFGSCGTCGGGIYSFPSSLGVATSTNGSLPATLSVYGGGYFSGNVGIGTTNPGYPLSVNGDIYAAGFGSAGAELGHYGLEASWGAPLVIWADNAGTFGAFMREDYNDLALGLVNKSGASYGGVNASSYMLGLKITGGGAVYTGNAVNTAIGTEADLVARNTLDDGSGNATFSGNVTANGNMHSVGAFLIGNNNGSFGSIGGQPYTGIYQPGTYYTMSIGTGNSSASGGATGIVERMRFNSGSGGTSGINVYEPLWDTATANSYFSGNVGIGTTNPNAKLQVAGYINFQDASTTTSVGNGAGNVNGGSYNAFFGYQAGNKNTSGGSLVAVGTDALFNNTNGTENTAVGESALYTNTTGYQNTALGSSALAYNTTGNYNIGVGEEALLDNTVGVDNTAVGSYALIANATGNDNTALGYNTLGGNTTHSTTTNETAIGSGALANDVAGNGNAGVGYQALYSNTTGINNTAIGSGAGYNNISESYNTFVGYQAGYTATSSGVGTPANTFVGYTAGFSDTTGVYDTAVGHRTLFANTTGYDDTANGAWALSANTTGNDNTAQGQNALELNTTGNYNTAVGSWALFQNATGTSNTALGYQAGNNSVGSGNVFLGYQAGYSETGSNKLYIADSSTNPPLIYGDFSTNRVGIGTTAPDKTLSVSCGSGPCADQTGGGSWGTFSDARLKSVKGDFTGGLAEVVQLNPVYYQYKPDNALGIKDFGTHVGLVAQDVGKVIPEAVSTDTAGYLILNNDPIIFAMLNAIKELNTVAVKVENGIVTIKNLVVDTLTAKKVSTQYLEMKDTATGDIYCVSITDGKFVKTKGACSN